MTENGKRLLLCVALSLLLCLAHIRGSMVLLAACLAAFMFLIAHACICDISFPLLLYFLPWSPILRLDPHSFSFYTFALVMVCAISILKKRFRFKRYHIAVALILAVLTLFSKLLDGSSLTFDYIAFLMLILVFPVVKEEWKRGKYDFYQAVVTFSVGIILAALCALFFASYHGLAQFIRIDAWLTVIRRSGFYGDANFYTAQITAALGGGLVCLLREKKRSRIVFLFILQVLLLYCGFLSASKSFALITVILLLLWIVSLFCLQGRAAFKLILILAAVVVTVFIATSELFRDLIQVFVTRFSFRANISDFTTGRTDVWWDYLQELLHNWKTLFLGEGYTKVIIGEKSTHNTLLQFVFQFGLLGTSVLLVWMLCFFMDAPRKAKDVKVPVSHVLLIVIGAFSPWLAIDTLFFDDFFLLQMFVYLGLRWICGQQAQQPHQEEAPELQKL